MASNKGGEPGSDHGAPARIVVSGLWFLVCTNQFFALNKELENYNPETTNQRLQTRN